MLLLPLGPIMPLLLKLSLVSGRVNVSVTVSTLFLRDRQTSLKCRWRLRLRCLNSQVSARDCGRKNERGDSKEVSCLRESCVLSFRERGGLLLKCRGNFVWLCLNFDRRKKSAGGKKLLVLHAREFELQIISAATYVARSGQRVSLCVE